MRRERADRRRWVNASAIGVFDSGVGGLSVLRHIRAQLPSVPLLYVADSGHVPLATRRRTTFANARSCSRSSSRAKARQPS